MKERPIIFSGPMVLAILEGRKTQTRRVVKYPLTNMDDERRVKSVISGCPYGQPGDHLWVRETWTDYDNDGDRINIIYMADSEEYIDSDGFSYEPKWKPSIFMPRLASRILLEITDVRVERVQDISEEDAEAEGISHSLIKGHEWNYIPEHDTKVKGVSLLWDSINAKRGYPWESNPWVWVVTFKKI